MIVSDLQRLAIESTTSLCLLGFSDMKPRFSTQNHGAPSSRTVTPCPEHFAPSSSINARLTTAVAAPSDARTHVRNQVAILGLADGDSSTVREDVEWVASKLGHRP